MGFDARFTLALAGWLAATQLALAGFVAALVVSDMAAVSVVAGMALVAAAAGLWFHVTRTNRTIARFLEALRHREFATRFDGRGGAGFDTLASALDAAMQRLQRERQEGDRELRFLEALVDDAPVALLAVDPARGAMPANKMARRMLDRHQGSHPDDFAIYGATFAAALATPVAGRRELLILRLAGGLQRAIVRTAAVERLGVPVHTISIEPVQGTLDSVEMAAQTDVVRVLTHEILNSLTPVMSLSRTLAVMLADPAPDLAGVRTGAAALARRTEGLRNFIDSYRAIARSPVPRPSRFQAAPFARELGRLFVAEWTRCRLDLEVEEALVLEADPDLLAQLLINLLRNAAQACEDREQPQVRFAIRSAGGHVVAEVEDNGPGIPDALRSDVFLPFFTTKREGTGIGLNLARQIAIASGWRIDIAGGALGGALFRVLLGR